MTGPIPGKVIITCALTGGIHGKVTGVADDVLTLEIAQNVRIKLSKSAVASRKAGEVTAS